MSDTYIHRDKAKFHKGILSYKETSDSFKKQCDRYNFDVGKTKQRRNKIKNEDSRLCKRWEVCS